LPLPLPLGFFHCFQLSFWLAHVFCPDPPRLISQDYSLARTLSPNAHVQPPARRSEAKAGQSVATP
jgi:hypothetical protein